MTVTAKPKMRVLPLDDVVPYWRNPRSITDEAVDKVADSITRYGYQNPIIVDDANVIITGHTRYKALRKLGVEKVPVIVADLDEKAAKEYRVLDNKTSELTAWDDDSLLMELREFSDATLEYHFADLDLGLEFRTDDLTVTDGDVADAEAKIADGPGPVQGSRTLTNIVCPSCFNEFEIDVTEKPVMP